LSNLTSNLDLKSLVFGALITYFIGQFTNLFETTVTASQLNTIARKIVDEEDYRKVLIDEIRNDKNFKGDKGEVGEPNVEEIAKKLAKEPSEILEYISRTQHFIPTSKNRKYGKSKFCALTSFSITKPEIHNPTCKLEVNKDFLWSIKVNGASCGVSCVGEVGI